MALWWLYISSRGETRKLDFSSQIWPCGSRSIAPKNNRDLNQGILQLWSKFGGPTLSGWWVIAWTTQDGVYFDFEVKFYLEGQGQSPLKTIWILNKVFYTYGQNLEIPSLNGRRVIARTDLVTDGLTDRQMQATKIPGGQNWPQVKMILILLVVGIPSRYCVEVTALLFMARLKSVSVTNLEPPRPCMIFTHTRCN